MDESHVRCFLGKGFKGQGDKRAGVATLGEHRDLPSLEVARVDWAFFTTSEYGDDTAKAGGLLEGWQEIDDESSAGVVRQGCGKVEAFWSLCVRVMVRRFISPLQNVLREPEQFGKNRGHTRIANQRSCGEEKEINRLLFALDVLADIIHGADQAGVCLDKHVLALRVQRLAFGCNAISGFLRAANKIDAGLAGMLGELFQRRFTDTTSGTDEDGDKTWRKSGCDARIRGLDV